MKSNLFILSINPGATSIKYALYNNSNLILVDEIKFSVGDNCSIEKAEHIYNLIDGKLREKKYKPEKLDIVVARGGVLPPVDSGAIVVDEKLVDYLLNKTSIIHASNLGAAIAYKFSKQARRDCRAYIYDPISVDQMSDLARFSGVKGINRVSLGHMLNSRAVAIKYCERRKQLYNNLNIIVIHGGTGITVTAHKKGRIVDLVTDEEGAFSTERSGGLPLTEAINYFRNNNIEDISKFLRTQSGLVSYFGTNDIRKLEDKINDGNIKVKKILEAMVYQIGKSIGSMYVVLKGNVDAIIFTGGLAKSKFISNKLRSWVKYLKPLTIYPGEYELEALAMGGLRISEGIEAAKKFEL